MPTVTRHAFLRLAAAATATAAFPSLLLRAASDAPLPATARDFEPLTLDKAAWRKRLPAERFEILFEEATERPHTSSLNGEKRDGTYVCFACNLPLFDASAKYESGTGWPSFWQPLSPTVVGTEKDFKLIWPRTEYHCARCGGHQGHVFEDGPPPTGQRWCNNGLALTFVPRDTPLPALVS